MSDQERGQDPYGQNPYGQPQGQPGSYGQSSTPNPYGQAYGSDSQDPQGGSAGQSQGQPEPYGSQAYASQPYGNQSYGAPAAGGGRPGTVTAAAWITIALSGLTAVLFGIGALLLLVSQDTIIDELETMPEFREQDIDPGSIVGVLVAFILVFVVWALIAAALGVFVLRRSNVARILLVISCVVTALGSLLLIASGFSAVWLIAAIAVAVLLFVGGAGAWFSGTSGSSGDYPGGGYAGGGSYGQGGQNPYGQQGGQQGGGADYPSSDYPGR